MTHRYEYEYDLRGNRVAETIFDGVNTVTTPATFNVANQIKTLGLVNYTYDSRGNLTDDGTWQYSYDTANRLIGTTGVGETASYAYNGFGDRISQSVNGTTTNYLLDLNTPLTQVLGEFAPGDEIWNLLGLDVIAQQTSSGWNYLHSDGLGSIRAISDASGLMTHAADYAPYGAPLTMGDSQSSFGFTGEMTDGQTGLTYLRARYYHPTSGTFLTKDPVMGVVGGPASTFNPYVYVRGNPVNLTDPSGRLAGLALAGAAALVGGFVGGVIAAAGNLAHQLSQNGFNLSCIDPGEMLREGLKGIIAGAAGGAALVGAVMSGLGAAMIGAVGAAASAAWGLATSVWGAATALAGTIISHGSKFVENVYKLAAHAIESGSHVWNNIFNAPQTSTLRDFWSANEFGVMPYSELRDILGQTPGTFLEAHHLIEQRFVNTIGSLFSLETDDWLSIALTPEEHRVFTSMWREIIPYGDGTRGATIDDILDAALVIYDDYPEILEALGLR